MPRPLARFILAALLAWLPVSLRAQARLDTAGPAGLPSWVTSVGARTEPSSTLEFRAADYGAINTGATLCTAAIQSAIDAAHAAGGGVVTFAPGTYLTGAIFLKSHVRLRIDRGVTLLGSQNLADYPVILSRVEGTEMPWPAGLININDATNVLIDGGGLIDCNGEASWTKWNAMNAGALDPHGVQINGHTYKTDLNWALNTDCTRVRLLVSWNATDLTLRDLRMRRSGFWTNQLIYSQHLTIDGLDIYDNTGPSTDGINLDSSSWALIQNNTINNNDDAITMKSGRGWDGKRVNRPTQFVVIRNNATINSHGSLSVGSETTGGVRRIVACNNYGSKSTLQGIRVKTSAIRGGVIEDLLFAGNFFNNVRYPVHVTLNWTTNGVPAIPADIVNYPATWELLARPIEPAADATPVVRHITIRDTTATGATSVIQGVGLAASRATGVLIDGVEAWGQNLGSLSYCSDWTLQNIRASLTGTATLASSNTTGTTFAALLSLTDTDGDSALDHWETARGGYPSSAAHLSRPDGPGITVAPFKNTAASGISSAKTYTHAVSGGAAVTVNGVPFSSLTTGFTPANFAWQVSAGTKGHMASATLNNWSPALGGLDASADAALVNLLGTFAYVGGVGSGDYQAYSLTGLTPGQWYECRVYLRTYDPASLRPVNLSFTNGWEVVRPFNAMPEDRPDLLLANRSPHSAAYIAYRYQAQTTRLTVRAATAPGSTAGFHLYALSNELAEPDLDRDGLSDSLEIATGLYGGPASPGTSPSSADADGDGESDGLEVARGTDPLDPDSHRKPGRVISAIAETNPAPTVAAISPATGHLFGEDAPAFTDRAHQWNGATSAGLPAYLVGQDYVLTANDARAVSGYRLDVTLSRPGRLYLLLDKRVAAPAWMSDGLGLDFTDTGDTVGWDESGDAAGPGVSVENTAAVYLARDTADADSTTLAAGTYALHQRGGSGNNMYGVVVAPLDADRDGIPDAAETANGLDPDWFDGPLDADGDGGSNLAEYLAGTGINNPDTDGDTHGDGLEFALGSDPLSSASVPPPPVCRSFAIHDGEAELEFFGLDPLRTYRLERSHDLADWTVRRTGLRPVEFGLFLLEPIPASERVFYVLRRE